MDSRENLKEIILNIREPRIIKSLKIPWKCFETPFDKWCKQFSSSISAENKDGVVFETGKRKHSDCPQWEKYRSKHNMSVTDFLHNSLNEDTFFKENWATLSYRNISELPEECRKNIDFNVFGFPEVNRDITFWLSSTGAHTPCHYDTYGCNVVVQVYGKKLWLLFPPQTKLTPVRIPYEESSVYCSENFYSPKDHSKFNEINKDCYKCILEAGDVLIVPAKWWHYVENLCPSLSINAWIPLQEDVETQIDECIVKIFIEHFIQDRNSEEARTILNPNEMKQSTDVNELFGILRYLTEHKLSILIDDPIGTKKFPYCYLSDDELSQFLDQFGEKIVPVPKLTKSEFKTIMDEHKTRFDRNSPRDMTTFETINSVKCALINSFCNPNIIKMVKKHFITNAK